MNFGQHWRTPGVRNISYTITLPLSFVLHLLARELPAYTEDCIAFPGDEPLEVGLRRRGWPAAEQVLDDPALCPLTLHWFAYDCLLGWLGDGEPESTPGYVINTIDLCERRGQEVRYSGTARETGQPIQYQDV